MVRSALLSSRSAAPRVVVAGLYMEGFSIACAVKLHCAVGCNRAGTEVGVDDRTVVQGVGLRAVRVRGTAVERAGACECGHCVVGAQVDGSVVGQGRGAVQAAR